MDALFFAIEVLAVSLPTSIVISLFTKILVKSNSRLWWIPVFVVSVPLVWIIWNHTHVDQETRLLRKFAFDAVENVARFASSCGGNQVCDAKNIDDATRTGASFCFRNITSNGAHPELWEKTPQDLSKLCEHGVAIASTRTMTKTPDLWLLVGNKKFMVKEIRKKGDAERGFCEE